MGKLTRQLLPFGTLVLIIGTLSILRPETFLSLDNFLNVLRRSSVPGIIALGMTFVIISAGIDLSVGSMLAIAGMIGGLVMAILPMERSAATMGLATLTMGGVIVDIWGVLTITSWLNRAWAGLLLKVVLAVSLAVMLAGFIWAAFGGAVAAYCLSGAAALAGLVAVGVYVAVPWGGFRAARFATAVTVVTAVFAAAWLVVELTGLRLSGMAIAWVCTVYGVMAGAVCGLMNGTLITKLKLPPFIVTLGTMSAFRGISYVMNDGQPYDMPTYRYLGEGLVTFWRTLEVPVPGQYFPEVEKILLPWQRVDLADYAEGSVLVPHGLPISILIFAVIIFAAGFLLKYSRLGRYTYAIGSNKEAAFHSGINVDLNLTAIYALTGLFVGIAAMIQNSRTVSAQPTAGLALELDVIAAVVIGGASLSGGRGTLTGTVIGILLISFLRNGCTMLGISTNIQLIVIGAIIIVAVSVDQLARAKAEAGAST